MGRREMQRPFYVYMLFKAETIY